jgi:hypothetical protein
MSQTYIAVIVSVIGSVLPKLGVEIGSEALTTTLSVLVTIGGAIWAMVGRYRAGGITKLGFRK